MEQSTKILKKPDYHKMCFKILKYPFLKTLVNVFRDINCIWDYNTLKDLKSILKNLKHYMKDDNFGDYELNIVYDRIRFININYDTEIVKSVNYPHIINETTIDFKRFFELYCIYKYNHHVRFKYFKDNILNIYKKYNLMVDDNMDFIIESLYNLDFPKVLMLDIIIFFKTANYCFINDFIDWFINKIITINLFLN